MIFCLKVRIKENNVLCLTKHLEYSKCSIKVHFTVNSFLGFSSEKKGLHAYFEYQEIFSRQGKDSLNFMKYNIADSQKAFLPPKAYFSLLGTDGSRHQK
jgi:hypothetical protein